MSELAIGVDIGGGSVKAGLFDKEGKEKKESKQPIPSPLNEDSFIDTVKAAILPLLGDPNIKGIGIGSPGPIDADKGILISSANMPSLKNIPLKEKIESFSSLPVYYNNDANCAALGESIFGSQSHTDSQLILTLGTGIGGGFVERKKLFSGFQGNGVEIGHTTVVIDGAVCGCGGRGCVESYFSTRGFLGRYSEKTGVSLKNAEEFFQKVSSNDANAKEILDFGIICLSEAVRGAIHILNPESIVFVGGITASWNLYGERLSKEIRKRIFPVLNERLKIEVGKNFAGSLGAACLVFSNLGGQK
ncbi:ROK family protein [Leptospira idonii]|uniref:ROK family protein n=2 Tax=Leptospira idonii TaxID=1193500 RepID=A0A4R9M232_9LEPT|nr:ROK family protein [Leptospira idonii]